jgi:putative NADH-flavin reductase
MKIVVFGGTGNIGQRIAKEALSRGHEVVAVVRDPARSDAPDPRVELVQGDATDARSVASVVKGADAVVNAISPRPGKHGKPAPSLADAARAVIAGLKEAGVKRLLVVGGAGSLEVAPGVALIDTPGFPEAYKQEAEEGRASLNVYRTEAEGLDWTYLSPAAMIQAGERTGRYRTTGDQFLTDAQGNSVISFEDYAVALVDELEKPQHVGRRFGVAY